MKLTLEINEDLYKRFEMALQLSGEDKDTVMEGLVKAYVVQAFSQTASTYQTELRGGSADKSFGKAVHKIPKWASKPMVIPSKIIRAYLQLLEEQGAVTYPELMLRCSDKENHPDEYIATFANNFAQMKFDHEKSHGKVFEVNSAQKITLWENVREVVMLNRDKFQSHATTAGYLNCNHQLNLGQAPADAAEHGQRRFRMRCEHCQTEYTATDAELSQKKCPACQREVHTVTD